MEIRSYNAELAIANLLFKRIFSNIVITRTNSKTGIIKEIPVYCTLDQRSRILKNWENAEKRATLKLPMIVITRTGYSRNSERLNNMHNEVKYEINSRNRIYDILTPVPIDISYDVSVISKYPSDIDQIASNFMVFFNNDIYVKSIHPKYEGITMNNQIVMQDSVSEEHPGELDGSTDDIITSTFNFTFKTYLFGGNQKIAKKQIDDSGNSNTSADSEIYEGFTPIVNQLSVGFYPTPNISSHVDYFNQTDNMELSDQWTNVDRVNWKI